MSSRPTVAALAVALATFVVPQASEAAMTPERAHALARQVLARPGNELAAFASLRLDEQMAVWGVLTDVRPAR